MYDNIRAYLSDASPYILYNGLSDADLNTIINDS